MSDCNRFSANSRDGKTLAARNRCLQEEEMLERGLPIAVPVPPSAGGISKQGAEVITNRRIATEADTRARVLQELYLTTWPDTWPDDLKLIKKRAWLAQHSEMTNQSTYERLLDDENNWQYINTDLCVVPPNPATADSATLQRFYGEQVVWAGVKVEWALNDAMLQKGVIKHEDIAYRWNRALRCPGLQARLIAEKVGTAVKNKAEKISEFQDKVLEGAGNAISGAGNILKGAGDNPLFSLGSAALLGGLALILLIGRSSGYA